MFFIVTLLLVQSFYIVTSDDDNDQQLVVYNEQPQKPQGLSDEVQPICVEKELRKYMELTLKLANLERMMEDVVRQEDSGLQPKKGVSFTVLDNESLNNVDIAKAAVAGAALARASAAGAASLDDKYNCTLAMKENPKLETFYNNRLVFVQQQLPDAIPYFDRDILAILGCQLDETLVSTEEKNLFEIYLWKLFLDIYKSVFKLTYFNLVAVLAQHRANSTLVCKVEF